MAFLNDSTDNKSPPPVVNLNNDDFQEEKAWLCLDVNTIVDSNHTSFKTILVPDYNNIAITTKIIPIQLLLVPLLLNGGKTLNLVGVFEMFVHEFYGNALEECKEAMQYIYDYIPVSGSRGHNESLGI